MIPFKTINIEEWIPADGFVLEKATMEVVKSDSNTLVVAGPGAGKTELLAQRACFLLQTNRCQYPRKILAISFKKDASKNLQERVEKRCGKELAKRFESKTYDAFAKEMLDRFYKGIPKDYRPSDDYEIANLNDIRDAFDYTGISKELPNNYRTNSKLSEKLVSNKLPFNDDIKHYETLFNTWRYLVGRTTDNQEPKLSFQMISRLTEWLFRTNKYLNNGIKSTYSHVFLDEFQDTTEIQYELVKSCFYNSKTIITAVGDNKQRIMLWAGAKEDIFEQYEKDFSASKYSLLMNHRSAPRLVEMQKMMYGILREEHLEIKSNSKWNPEDGEANLRVFDNHLIESIILSNEIENLVNTGLEVNDICILVKQRVDDYGAEVIKELANKGIKARNESVYQDFLKEEIIVFLINIIYLAVKDRAPEEWQIVNNLFLKINSIDDIQDIKKIQEYQIIIESLIEEIRLGFNNINESKFKELINGIVKSIGIDKLKSYWPQYKKGGYMTKLLSDFIQYLWKEYEESKNWIEAVENLEGKYSIPIMTIHKSKGLEFDTIIFLGLEDSAFWNFSNQPDEDRCTFFVALSRAKRRVDFTFSKKRPVGFSTLQKRNTIREFYDLFEESGIVEKFEYSDK